MNNKEIKSNTIKVLSEILKVKTGKITLKTTANDISEWDSLSNIKIILGIEKKFKIKIPTSEVFQLKNVGELIKLISKTITDK